MRFTERGDTIVEVLLAVLIIGAVLTGAYVTANQTLNANRASQERSEALKYVEGQLEHLKANIDTLGSQPGAFCFDKNTGAFDGSFTDPAAHPNLGTDNFAYPAGCDQGLVPGGYHLSIRQSGTTYTVNARWDGAGSSGRQQTTMYYRVAP
jgi:type II secretory pathway pseudopilin PulG